MSTDLASYLPSYPIFDQQIREELSDLLPDDSVNPNESFFRKLEFYENRLPREREQIDMTQREVFFHQRVIARFLNAHTPYMGLLVMHEPGTGKTHAGIHLIELIRESSTWFKGAVIITPNDVIQSNFQDKLETKCEAGDCDKVAHYNYNLLGTFVGVRCYTHQLPGMVNLEKVFPIKYYTFGELRNKYASNPAHVIEQFNHRVIIMDEVHRLRRKENQSTYNGILNLLHNTVGCKVLLLSGTPMFDRANELALVLNFIMPLNNQIGTGNEFDTYFFDQEGNLKQDTLPELKEIIRGRVSYLRQALDPNVKREYFGTLKHAGMTLEKLEQVDMSEFQTKHYLPYWEEDRKKYATSDLEDDAGDTIDVKGDDEEEVVDDANDEEEEEEEEEEEKHTDLPRMGAMVEKTKKQNCLEDDSKRQKSYYLNSKQACNMVLPNQTIGSGLNNYVMCDSKGNITGWKDGMNFLGDTPTQRVESLEKFSTKFAKCISHILAHPNQLHFVYFDNLLNGAGGAKFFHFLLRQIDYASADKYRLIHGETTKASYFRTLDQFNADANWQGKDVRVLIGTQVMSEAITLKNVSHMHMLSVPFNYTRIDQAMARGYRIQSHAHMLKMSGPDAQITVKIHFYCALPAIKTKLRNSVDYFLYGLCARKDREIKAVERVIQEASVDCALNYERNLVTDASLVNARDCMYQECTYTCDGVNENDVQHGLLFEQLDFSTFDQFYGASVRKQVQDYVVDQIVLRKTYSFPISSIPVTLTVPGFSPPQIISLPYLKRIVLRSLFQIRYNQSLNGLRDDFSNPLFLHIEGDRVYLTHTPERLTTFFDAYYAQNVTLHEPVNTSWAMYRDFVDFLSLHGLDRLCGDTAEITVKDVKDMLSLLPLQMTEQLLESCVKWSKQSGVDTNTTRGRNLQVLCAYVNKEYQSYLVHQGPSITVSKLLKPQGQFRTFEQSSGVWRDSTEEEKERLKDQRASDEQRLAASGMMYLGVKEHAVFKLRNLHAQPKKKSDGGVALSSVATGQDCKTRDKHVLLRFLLDFGLDPTEGSLAIAGITKSKDIQEIRGLMQMNETDIDEEYTNLSAKDRTNIDNVCNPREGYNGWESLSRQQQQRLLAWNKASKPEICKYLQHVLEQPVTSLPVFQLLRFIHAFKMEPPSQIDVDVSQVWEQLPEEVQKAFPVQAKDVAEAKLPQWRDMSPAEKTRVLQWFLLDTTELREQLNRDPILFPNLISVENAKDVAKDVAQPSKAKSVKVKQK